MNIIEMIEKYEALEYDYNQAEEKASEYEKEYMQMTNIGYNEEDFYTHSMATCWSNYENEMEEIRKEIEKNDISDTKILIKQLIKEFKTIEINILIKKLNNWFNSYDNIFGPNPHIEKKEYFIIKKENKKTIKLYNKKEFYKWLQKELEIYDLWDGEMTCELEELIQIVHPKYYHLSYY